MSNYATITNTNFDNAAALVPAPFTITRSGNVAAMGPNSHMPVKVTAFSATKELYVSYDTLNDTDRRNKWVEDNFGIETAIWKILLAAKIIDAHIDGYAPPPSTPAEQQAIFRALQTLPTLFATMPLKAVVEADQSLVAKINIGTGTFPAATLTLTGSTITGSWQWGLIDWGDDQVETIAYGDDIATKSNVYAVDGTYTVRVMVMGPGGILESRKDFTINVP